MGFVFFDPSAVFLHPNAQSVQSNATVTVSGSSILAVPYGLTSVLLAINIKNAPTGTSPTLTFTLQDVDPGDQTTLFGSADSTAALNAAGTTTLEHVTKTGYVKVSWTIGGSASPTFTGVYSTVVGIEIGPTSLGQKTMSNSLSVVVASDQGAVPVSGTVTANIGTTNGLALDATLTGGGQKTQVVNGANTLGINGSGQAAIQNPPNLDAATSTLATSANQTNGNQKGIVRGGAKGTTVAADVTSNPIDANTQALHVDGSHVTQPVSGTVTSNIGTTNGLALDATLTGGTAKEIVRGGQKGTTNTNADITHTPSGANHEALDVAMYDGSGNQLGLSGSPVRTDPTGTTTQPVSGTVTSNQGTAAAASGAWPAKVTDGTNVAAVKAASTAPAATDPSLVVTISPNSPTQGVSGTVTANQGTPNSLANAWPMEVTDGTTGPVAVKAASTQAAAADKSFVVALSPNSNQVQGQAANGAALSGNPVLSGGSDGVDARSLATDANGVVLEANIAYAVATGRLTGSTGRFAGETTAAATGVEAAIRGTTYTEQTSNAQRSLNSTSASDASAGTGARTVRVTYYSISGSTVTGPFTEDVTMNGTTAVNMVSTTVCFVESLEVITAGTGGTNAGTIQIFTTTAGGGSVFASIAAGAWRTTYCHHYVASGRHAFLTDFMTTSTAASAQFPDFHLRSKDLGTTNSSERRVMDHMQQQGSINSTVRTLASPIVITGPARVVGYVTTTNSVAQTNMMEVGYYEV